MIKSRTLANLPLHDVHGKPIGRQKFIKMVVEKFQLRNIYIIFNFKSKSVMNRPNLIMSEAKLPLHAHGKLIGRQKF